MAEIIITGASRGIGRALARALAGRGEHELILVARDASRLAEVAAQVRAQGRTATSVVGDLGTVSGARSLGERLREAVSGPATLVHNAGVWPTRREVSDDGFERAFVVNHLGPLAMQAPLLDAQQLRRIMVVSAGLIAKGRFDADRTPTGSDFSAIRTYCTTKLCFAIAMRDVAEAHPNVDVVALHPGIVRTDLGARTGVLGWLLSLVKRRWEDPQDCAERLATLLAQPRWSPPGDPRWLFEADERPWPEPANDPATVDAVRAVTARLLSSSGPADRSTMTG